MTGRRGPPIAWTAIWLVAAMVVVAGCRPMRKREAAVRPDAIFGPMRTLVFGGDTVLARRMHAGVTDADARAPLGAIRPILASGDMTLVNLECILSSRGDMQEKGEQTPYHYRGRPDLVRVLVEGGVDMVTLANNHAGDYGPDALLDGIAILDAAGIQHAGAGADLDRASTAAFRTIGDVNAAVIGIETTQPSSAAGPNRPGTNYVSERSIDAAVDVVRRQIARARTRAHLVFVTVHWGINNVDEPTPERVRLAHAIIDAGADAILGHSAHRTQGLEIYHRKPILYDAGNLLWDYDDEGPSHQGLVFRLHFDRSGVRWIEAIPVRLHENRTEPAGPEDAEAAIGRFADLSRRMGTEVMRFPDREGGGLEPIGYIAIRDAPRIDPPGDETPFAPAAEPSVPPDAVLFPIPNTVVDALPQDAIPIEPPVRFEYGIQLIAYRIDTPLVRRRRPLTVTTWWRATGPVPDRFQIFLHMDPTVPGQAAFAGGGAGEHDAGDWSYPTNRWRQGDLVEDRFNVRPRGDAPPGTWAIHAGLWHAPSGRRLRVIEGRHDGNHRVPLGTFQHLEHP